MFCPFLWNMSNCGIIIEKKGGCIMDTTENNNYDQCVTNDTFIEYQNAAEWNKDQRLTSLKNSISFTNLWLGIIAAYCAFELLKEIVLVIILYNAGTSVIEVLQLLGNLP